MLNALAVAVALVLAAIAGALPGRAEDTPAPMPEAEALEAPVLVLPAHPALPPPLAVVRIGTDHAFCTGFFLGGPNALVATAGHCLEKEGDVTRPFSAWLTNGTKVTLQLAAWTRFPAGLDDLAVFALHSSLPRDWKPLVLNCDTPLHLGDHVTLDSFPGAIAPYLIHSEGVIVIDGAVVMEDAPSAQPLYVAALSVAPGSSGAPVLGADGRVVAIAIAYYPMQPAWSLLQPIAPLCALLHQGPKK